MPRKRAWSPLRGFEGGGWYVLGPLECNKSL